MFHERWKLAVDRKVKELFQVHLHVLFVLLLVKRNPHNWGKPNYWVKSHLFACWSGGKNAWCLIDLATAPPSGSSLHHPNLPLSTVSTRGPRPKSNMSKEDDTDNSHNRSSHMLPRLQGARMFQLSNNFQSLKGENTCGSKEKKNICFTGRHQSVRKDVMAWMMADASGLWFHGTLANLMSTLPPFGCEVPPACLQHDGWGVNKSTRNALFVWLWIWTSSKRANWQRRRLI